MEAFGQPSVPKGLRDLVHLAFESPRSPRGPPGPLRSLGETGLGEPPLPQQGVLDSLGESE